MAVDILGHSANMTTLLSIAQRRRLRNCDAAQSPSSLNDDYWNHGTCRWLHSELSQAHSYGEGGIVVTNDDDIAKSYGLFETMAKQLLKWAKNQ